MAIRFTGLIDILLCYSPSISTSPIKEEIMENSYMAYTKEIDGVIFYFVKKYTTFPDYEDFPKVLDCMGMHTDFYKACAIAEIYDENVVSDLMKQLHIIPDRARIIQMNNVKSITHSFLKNTQQAILKLRWASIH